MDGFFPEVARELSNRGAEIIAWPVWGCNPDQARARACENHVYLVSSTYEDVSRNWMLTAVYGQDGRVLAQATEWGTICIAEVDLTQRTPLAVVGRFFELGSPDTVRSHAVSERRVGISRLQGQDDVAGDEDTVSVPVAVEPFESPTSGLSSTPAWNASTRMATLVVGTASFEIAAKNAIIRGGVRERQMTVAKAAPVAVVRGRGFVRSAGPSAPRATDARQRLPTRSLPMYAEKSGPQLAAH